MKSDSAYPVSASAHVGGLQTFNDPARRGRPYSNPLFHVSVNRRKLSQLVPGIIILFVLGVISVLAYVTRGDNGLYAHLIRDLYILPLLAAGWFYGSIVTFLLSLGVTALFIPLQVGLLYTGGLNQASIELLADLISYNLAACLTTNLAQSLRYHQKLLNAVDALGELGERSHDTDRLLSLALEQSIELSNADGGQVFLSEEGASSNANERDRRPATYTGEAGEGSVNLIEWLLQRSEITMLKDVEADSRFVLPSAEVFARRRMTLMAVPLRRGQRQVAAVVLWNYRGRRFKHNEIQLLHVLAGKVGAAMENAWLHSQTDETLSKRTRELSTLLEASYAFSSTHQLDELAAQLCQRMTTLVESTFGRVYLLSEDRARLTLHAFSSIRETSPAPIIGSDYRVQALPWHESVMVNRQPVVLLNDDPATLVREPERTLLFGQGNKSALLAPLVVRDHALGVAVLSEMRVWQRSPFTHDKIELCQALARQAALSLENRRAFQSMTFQNERTRLFIDDLPDGVVSTDPEGRVATFNRAAERITGYSAPEVIGRSFEEIFECSAYDDQTIALEQVAGSTFAHEPIRSKEWITRRDGKRIQVVHSAAAVTDKDRHNLGAVSILREITREEELAWMRSNFNSLVSHELRTPLTNISLAAEVLAKSDLGPEAQRDLLQTLGRESMRLKRLAEQVLEATRLEQGQRELSLEPLALVPLLERVQSSYRAEHPDYCFELRLPDKQIFALGDQVSVEVVLENLLRNAVNYSPPDSTVTVAVEEQKDAVTITVSDQGIGIPVDELDGIFQRYHRVDQDTQRKSKGFGLGLFIAKMLVEAQGGSIWAESEPGQGSRFKFRLRALGERNEEKDPGH